MPFLLQLMGLFVSTAFLAAAFALLAFFMSSLLFYTYSSYQPLTDATRIKFCYSFFQ